MFAENTFKNFFFCSLDFMFSLAMADGIVEIIQSEKSKSVVLHNGYAYNWDYERKFLMYIASDVSSEF
jgi:hypothetical protein